MDATDPSNDAPIIFSYTRAQAIDDGVLIDLTEWARETGFTIPVACTAAMWNGWVVPPDGTRELGQSERGRAHDLLWMLWNAIRRSAGSDRLTFEVMFLQPNGRHKTVTLKAMCAPGDDGEPVLTILLPNED